HEEEMIRCAVKEVERRTSGELVPLIVPESSDYGAHELLGAFTLTMPLAIGVAYLVNWMSYGQHDTLAIFLIAFVPGFALCYLLMNLCPALKRAFIPDATMEEEVRETASAAFFAHGLHKTRDESGILLYISVFERRVWILADRGINTNLPDGTWDEIVADLTRGIKQKKRGEAICAAIRRIGELLVAHCPAYREHANELPDLVVGKEEDNAEEA
ncbi:MAG TPA: TPM domain-containing protein, partial [bacterium]|nr:TPM domain-containing protein [bacterium]